MRNVITIDGPAASGKSTVASLLANKIGFRHLDTGALYRSVTVHLLCEQVSLEDEEKVRSCLETARISVPHQGCSFFLGEKDISKEIRSDAVTKSVIEVAKIPSVRQFVQDLQKTIVKDGLYVVEGRDIGTVIFPDSFCKFYLDARLDIRTDRRIIEKKLDKIGHSEEVRSALFSRDEQDKNRSLSPLKLAEGAVVIDSSELSAEEVVSKMLVVLQSNGFSLESKKSLESEVGTTSLTKEVVTDLVKEVVSDLAKEVSSEKTVAPVVKQVSSTGNIFLDAVENIESVDFQKGQIIDAKVISISSKEIILTVGGGKTDAVIIAPEAEEISTKLSLQQELQVVVSHFSNSGMLIVSYKEIQNRKYIKMVQEAFAKQEPIEGIIRKSAKGGLIVELFGWVSAYCPLSEFDFKKINPYNFFGKTCNFLVVECTDRRLILSRKKVLESTRDNFFASIKKGSVLEGEVVGMTAYAAFVEVSDGVTGILRNTQVSWNQPVVLEEHVKLKDKIKVSVLSLDAKEKKLELSLRTLAEDPFFNFAKSYQLGQVLQGVITNVEAFGAFAKIEDGIEGLIHVSELSWVRRIRHPKEMLKKGQEVSCVLLDIDTETRRVSLSLRQVESDPWSTIESLYPKGNLVSAKVKRVVRSGVFFTLDDQFESIMKAEDAGWGRYPSLEEFKEGDEHELMVLGYEESSRLVCLGRKQKMQNPWENFVKKYRMGDTLAGKVIRVASSGFVIEVEGVEGFCHKSRLEGFEDGEKQIDVGQEVSVFIQSIREEERSLFLGIRGSQSEMFSQNQQERRDPVSDTISLGDLLGQKK